MDDLGRNKGAPVSVHVERVEDLPGDSVMHFVADDDETTVYLLASEFSERAADALRSFTRVDRGRIAPPGRMIVAAT